MEPNRERAPTDAEPTGDKIQAKNPAKMARDGVRHVMKTVWSIPTPDAFGAWRQPRDAGQRRLGWLLLAWGVVLAGLGIAAGFFGLP